MELSLNSALRNYRRLLFSAMMGDVNLEKQKVCEAVYEAVSSDIRNVIMAMKLTDELNRTEFVFNMTIPESVCLVHIMIQVLSRTELPLIYSELTYPDFELIQRGLKQIESVCYRRKPRYVEFSHN